jgi:hypothetical protein
MIKQKEFIRRRILFNKKANGKTSTGSHNYHKFRNKHGRDFIYTPDVLLVGKLPIIFEFMLGKVSI